MPKAADLVDQEDAWNRLFADVTDYVTTLRHCSFFLAEMFNQSAEYTSFGNAAAAVQRRSAALYRSGVVAPYRPLLLAARLAHPGDGELYTRLVDVCERYSARVFVIRQRRANAGVARLLRLAHDLYRGEDPDRVVNEVRTLLWRYAPDADVRDSLLSARENWYGRRGHKYFLYEYELDLKAPGQELPPMGYFTDAAREQRTTEHILPRNPNPDDECWWRHFTGEEHAELQHSLGNLALTYDNSVYSNKCFAIKRGKPLAPGEPESKCYAQATLKQERLLAQYDEWTPRSIRERQAVLADWALGRWAVTSPDVAHLEAEEIDIEPEGTEEDEGIEAAGSSDAQDEEPPTGATENAVWLARLEREARSQDEFGTLPALPDTVVTLRDHRRLRWERIAVRIYGDPRRTADVRRLYDEAKGPGASTRSYTGLGRRFPGMTS